MCAAKIQEVIRGNIKGADAALEFPAGDRQQFIWDEFPHAIEYLIYAYLQTGADDADGYYGDLRKKGIKILSHIETKPWEMREFAVASPEGHRITIGQWVGENR